MHSKRTINTQIDPRGQEQPSARSYVSTPLFRLQRSQRPMAIGMLKKKTLYVGDIMQRVAWMLARPAGDNLIYYLHFSFCKPAGSSVIEGCLIQHCWILLHSEGVSVDTLTHWAICLHLISCPCSEINKETGKKIIQTTMISLVYSFCSRFSCVLKGCA